MNGRDLINQPLLQIAATALGTGKSTPSRIYEGEKVESNSHYRIAKSAILRTCAFLSIYTIYSMRLGLYSCNSVQLNKLLFYSTHIYIYIYVRYIRDIFMWTHFVRLR